MAHLQKLAACSARGTKLLRGSEQQQYRQQHTLRGVPGLGWHVSFSYSAPFLLLLEDALGWTCRSVCVCVRMCVCVCVFRHGVDVYTHISMKGLCAL